MSTAGAVRSLSGERRRVFSSRSTSAGHDGGDAFRVRSAAHDVRIHTTGLKRLHYPVVGDLDLPFETFALGADPRQSLLMHTAAPGSPSQDALNLLASGAATTDGTEQRAIDQRLIRTLRTSRGQIDRSRADPPSSRLASSPASLMTARA
jgi:hypothetical protein